MADLAPEPLDVSRSDSGTARLSGSAKFFIVLSFLLGVLAVSMAVWIYTQITVLEGASEQRQQTAQEILALQQQYERSAADQANLTSQLAELGAQLEALDSGFTRAGMEFQQRLTVVSTELSSEIQRLARDSSQASVLLELLEARYLLRSAELSMRFQQDFGTTALLIKRVLDQLDALDDLALLPLKAQLEKDLEALKQLDISGIQITLLKLETIEHSWPTLLPDIALRAAPLVDTGASSFAQQLLGELRQLVQIRFLSNPDQVQFDANAYLSETERDLLRMKFDAALTQARVALMRRDTAGFQENLSALKRWHQQFADRQSAATEANLIALENLGKLDLAPQHYDLSVSTEIIDTLLDNRK